VLTAGGVTEDASVLDAGAANGFVNAAKTRPWAREPKLRSLAQHAWRRCSDTKAPQRGTFPVSGCCESVQACGRSFFCRPPNSRSAGFTFP